MPNDDQSWLAEQVQDYHRLRNSRGPIPERIERRTSLLLRIANALKGAIDGLPAPTAVGGVYGDGRHGAVEFIDGIFELASPVQATTLVIDSAWMKSAFDSPHGLVLRATESITIRGGCLFTAVGNTGMDASGPIPGASAVGNWQGAPAGGASRGTHGGAGATEDGLGSPGVDVLDGSNMGGWASLTDPTPQWDSAFPQQGGNGGTTGGSDGAVQGGVTSRGSAIDPLDYILRGIRNGVPLSVGGCGGAGGNSDGGGTGGGGGEGGGPGSDIILSAPRIIWDNCEVTRDVAGGAGGNGGHAIGGNCGGGGGGAGGNCGGIYDVTESWEVVNSSIVDYFTPHDGNALGGSNGNGSGAGTTGSNGSDGLPGRTYLINPATMQFTNRD